MTTFYKERQKFTQVWLWLIIIASTGPCIGFITYGFIQQVLLGQTWGNNPMSDIGLIVTTLLTWIVCAGAIWAFLVSELHLEIHDRAVYYKFPVFSPGMKKINLEFLESWAVRKFGAFEFGGYGVRHTLGKKTSFLVRGRMGLELKLKNGKTLMIGTQEPDEVQRVMQIEWDRMLNKNRDG